MDHSTSYISVVLSKVVDLAILCTSLTIGWALSGWKAGITITATLLRYFGMCLQFSLNLSLPHSYFILSKSFVLFKLFIIVDWAFLPPLFLPMLGLDNLPHLYILQFGLVPLLFLPACCCHLTCL